MVCRALRATHVILHLLEERGLLPARESRPLLVVDLRRGEVRHCSNNGEIMFEGRSHTHRPTLC